MNPIKKVYELFQDRNKWTTRAFCRTADDTRLLIGSAAAVKWCLVGALSKYGADHQVARAELLEIAVRLYPNCDSLQYLNDAYGYDAVMQVLKTAIEEIEE